MDNRRQDYRHSFAPHRRLRVDLTLTATAVEIRGEIVNLSLGGMAVCLPEANPALPKNARVRAEFHLAPDNPPLTYYSEVVHTGGSESPIYGFQFLPLAEPRATETREQRLWRFLMEAQRQERRK